MTWPSGVSNGFVNGYWFAIPLVAPVAGTTMLAVALVISMPQFEMVFAPTALTSLSANSFHCPLGSFPLRTLRFAFVRLPGPGAGQVSAAPWLKFDGRNAPLEQG